MYRGNKKKWATSKGLTIFLRHRRSCFHLWVEVIYQSNVALVAHYTLVYSPLLIIAEPDFVRIFDLKDHHVLYFVYRCASYWATSESTVSVSYIR